MTTKEEALHALTAQTDLCEIYELAPLQTGFLIELALTCTDLAWRFADQSLLAFYAARIAGPDANHPQLRTRRHEEVLLAFIDWLLPNEMEKAS